MRTVLTLLLVVPFAYYGYLFGRAYLTGAGTFWERFLRAGKESATIAYAQLVMFASSFLGLIGQLVDAASGDPNADQAVHALPPEYLAWGLIVLFGLSVVARLRTLGEKG